MGIQRIKRKAGVVLAATALLTSVPGFVAATTAQAAATATCWSTPTPNNSDFTMKLNGTYNLKIGVGSVCDNVWGGPWSSGTIFYAWCVFENPDSGVVWYFGRIKGTQIHGYTSSANLNYVSGSKVGNCNDV